MGIGTTNPTVRLSFGVKLENTLIALWDNGIGGKIGMGIDHGDFIFHLNQAGDRYVFYDDVNLSNEIMCVQNNGRVGIGTSNPSQQLHVVGNICYTGSSSSCSDIRYKMKIEQLTDVLSNLQKIKGVSYSWKTDEFPEKSFTEDRQIGVIAQELEAVYPELVSTDEQGFKTVDYPKLTAVLIEANKELQKTVAHLSASHERLAESFRSFKADFESGQEIETYSKN